MEQSVRLSSIGEIGGTDTAGEVGAANVGHRRRVLAVGTNIEAGISFEKDVERVAASVGTTGTPCGAVARIVRSEAVVAQIATLAGSGLLVLEDKVIPGRGLSIVGRRREERVVQEGGIGVRAGSVAADTGIQGRAVAIRTLSQWLGAGNTSRDQSSQACCPDEN